MEEDRRCRISSRQSPRPPTGKISGARRHAQGFVTLYNVLGSSLLIGHGMGHCAEESPDSVE